MNRQTCLLASALALAALSTSAFSTSAFAADGSGDWYVRGEVGNSRLSVQDFSGHHNDTAYGVRGGYWFNPNFAAEAFYTDYGSSSSAGDSAKLEGIGAGIVGKKNFGPDNSGFFIDGRAGLQRAKTSVRLAGIGSSDDHSTKPYVGVGAGYDFSKSFGMSVNYDYNRADAFGGKLTARTLTLGGEYRF